MKEQLTNELVQFVISILGIVATYLLMIAQNYIREMKVQLLEKGKADQFNRALQIARGMYFALEDEFKSVEKAGLDKKAEMEKRLLEVIPGLSQVELDSINKQIWVEFNDKVVKEVLSPIQK